MLPTFVKPAYDSKWIVAVLILTSYLGLETQSTFAQQSKVLEEVIVTAQKREQSIQDVPITISALSGEEITNLNLEIGRHLQDHTPGLIWAGTNHIGKPELFIRGVGFDDFQSATGSPVALYHDNVIQGSLAGASMQLFDTERVEVLKGPQGTLWGKNTTGGLIHVIPRKAEVGAGFNGFGMFTAAEANQFVFEGAVGIPISDHLAARISVKHSSFDGYMTNINPAAGSSDANGWDWQALRGQLAWEPTENFRARFVVNYSDADADGTVPKVLGGADYFPCTNPFRLGSTCADAFGNVNPTDPQTTAADFVGYEKPENLVFALHLEHDFNWGTVTSITSYQNTDRYLHTDDGTQGTILASTFESFYEGFTQELRIRSSNTLPFDWTAGVYYQDDDLDTWRGDNTFSFIINGRDVKVDSTIAGIFADATYDLTDKLSLTGGVRVTYDKRESSFLSYVGLVPFGLVPPPPETVLDEDYQLSNPAIFLSVPLDEQEKDWVEPSARVALTYSVDENTNVFVGWSRGFRGGEPNAGADAIGEFNISEPEFLESIEGGIKGRWLDDTLAVNVSAFYYDYSDKILFLELPPTEERLAQILLAFNGNKAEIYGMEAEVNWQANNHIAFDLGATWTEGEYTEISPEAVVPFSGGLNPQGNKVENLPELTFNGIVKFNYPLANGGVIFANFDAVWWDNYYSSLINNPAEAQEAFWRLGASIGYTTPDGHWKARFWGKNLTDKAYVVDSFIFGGRQAWIGDPRVFGGTISYEF